MIAACATDKRNQNVMKCDDVNTNSKIGMILKSNWQINTEDATKSGLPLVQQTSATKMWFLQKNNNAFENK